MELKYTPEQFRRVWKDIIEAELNWAEKVGIGSSCCETDKRALADCVHRVLTDKKRLEDHHGDLHSLKVFSLTSHWIAKIKPFRVRDTVLTRKCTSQFWVRWFNESLAIAYAIESSGKSVKCLNGQFLRDLRYSLRNRDLSSSALILLFEGISLHLN